MLEEGSIYGGIKLFIIEDLLHTLVFAILVFAIIYFRINNILFLIVFAFSATYFLGSTRELIYILIDVCKKDLICDKMDMFYVKTIKFDWMFHLKYSEIGLNKGKKMFMKTTTQMPIVLGKVNVSYLKQSKIAYKIEKV